jgi:hypothetical protein
MKFKFVILALCLFFGSYFLIGNKHDFQTDLSIYTGHNVSIAREIHSHNGESLFYVDFQTDSKICTAVVGKQSERYYYINLPRCELML